MKWPTKPSVVMLSAVLSSAALILATSTGRAARVDYQYDNAGRLINTRYDTCTNTAYTLDAAGNRKTVDKGTSSATPGVLQLAESSRTVSEGDGSISIQVNRMCGSGGSVSVSYALGGTASNGSDYSVSGSLSWGAGDSTPKYLTLNFVNDSEVESTENVVLTLQSPTDGASIGSVSSINVSVVDNDVPPPPPPPPSVPNAPYVTRSGKTLSWAAVSGATSYEVWNEFGSRVYQGTGTSVTVTVPYCESVAFYALACNTSGCSAQSNTVHVLGGTPPSGYSCQ